jgi:hypothetical protein
MKTVGIAFASLFGLFALMWIVQGNDFFMYKFFAPKYEDARREVFENTQSYVEGKRQDLVKYRLEYMRAKTDEEKSALKYTIVQEFANFDETKLPDGELRSFLYQMKYE